MHILIPVLALAAAIVSLAFIVYRLERRLREKSAVIDNLVRDNNLMAARYQRLSESLSNTSSALADHILLEHKE